jgi:hypothetical protein
MAHLEQAQAAQVADDGRLLARVLGREGSVAGGALRSGPLARQPRLAVCEVGQRGLPASRRCGRHERSQVRRARRPAPAAAPRVAACAEAHMRGQRSRAPLASLRGAECARVPTRCPAAASPAPALQQKRCRAQQRAWSAGRDRSWAPGDEDRHTSSVVTAGSVMPGASPSSAVEEARK